MKAAIAKKWIKALRSGDYEQGRGVLKSTDDKYCCLGVLCDVVNPAGWVGKSYRGSTLGLTTVLCEELGMPNDVQADLMDLNDGSTPFNEAVKLPKSFKYIATYIEKNYKKWSAK